MTPRQLVRDRLVWLASAAVALGILLIVLAETIHWEWAKVFAAGLIAIGGVGLGVELGLTGPRNWKIVDRLKAARLPVAYIIIAFTTVPMLAVLLAAFLGVVGDMGDTSAIGVAGGVLITFFMAVASLVAVVMTIRAVQTAFQKSPPGSSSGDTLDHAEEGDA